MAYSDRWGLTVTKLGLGTFQVSRLGQSVVVTIDQVFGDDAIDAAAALFRAIQRLAPDDPTWQRRVEYAVSRWKLAGYQRLIDAASGATRTALRAKRDVWVAEEQRLRTVLGVDA